MALGHPPLTRAGTTEPGENQHREPKLVGMHVQLLLKKQAVGKHKQLLHALTKKKLAWGTHGSAGAFTS